MLDDDVFDDDDDRCIIAFNPERNLTSPCPLLINVVGRRGGISSCPTCSTLNSGGHGGKLSFAQGGSGNLVIFIACISAFLVII